MVAVKDSKDLYCLKCEFCHKIKCCNGWKCLLAQEIGYPAYADAFDRLDNCPLVATDCKRDIFVIDDREYTKDEVLEILKKHKEEEDKKYHKCERCGTRYLQNNTFDMVTHNLDKKPDNCSAWGYASTPYIRGFKILSTCGDGREVKLCDDCIFELKRWLVKV